MIYMECCVCYQNNNILTTECNHKICLNCLNYFNENINVSIKEIYCDNKRKTTFVESELTFNNEIKLKVIDILTFNDKNELCGIKAYKM